MAIGGVASLAGAGAVAQAVSVGGKAAGMNKVQRVTKAATAGAKTTARGMGRGAVRGAMGERSGMGGIYAGRDASSRARQEAQRAQAANHQAQRAAEREAEPESPAAYAADRRKRDSAATGYERDYPRYKDDPTWVKRVKDATGSAPLDPKSYRWEGYGRSAADIRRDSSLGFQPLHDAPEEPRREQRAPRPTGSNTNPPKSGSAGQQPPRRPQRPGTGGEQSMPKPQR